MTLSFLSVPVSLPKATKLSAALALCVCALTTANAQAQESKIGFVNTQRIISESTPAKIGSAKIEQEFSKRDKELQDMASRLKTMSDKMDKDSAVLSESDRTKRQRELTDLDKDFQRKQREFREDLNQRKNEEISTVQDRANKAIKQIAESEKFDLVLQDALYASPRIDITEKVLKVLNK